MILHTLVVVAALVPSCHMDLSGTPQPVAVDMDQHEVGHGTQVVADFVVGNFE